MTLLALGINHQTAPVSLRERVAFADDALASIAKTFNTTPDLSRFMLLSMKANEVGSPELMALTSSGESASAGSRTNPSSSRSTATASS